MRLLSLNCWGAKQGELFFSYIASQAENTDIFCLQEVYRSGSDVKEYQGCRTNLFSELSSILKEHHAYFSVLCAGFCNGERVDFPVEYGLATFVRKSLASKLVQAVPIVPESMSIDDGRALQHVEVQLSRPLSVYNFHGLALPGDKLDTPERLMQSRLIVEALSANKLPKILCGDFNLMPETQSIQLLERGTRNLIKDYGIKNTRNEISWALYKNRQYFADYTFVSPEIKVQGFEVPYNLASDHLPMVLEFTI